MKVLILSASTGGGHNRAANALKDYILRHDPDSRVQVVDAIKECSKLMNATVTKGYEFLVTKTPTLFGKIYEVSDRESILSDMVNNINGLLAGRIAPMIDKLQPDIIVSCHPFAAKMVTNLKKKHGYNIPILSILTDFMPHMAYIDSAVNAYVTAADATADALADEYGIDRSLIHPLGMPVFERFYHRSQEKRAEILSSLGFDSTKPTVLMMAGMIGVSDILHIYERMVDTDLDYQIIVITGRNRRLYSAFEQLLSNKKEFQTEEVPEFIASLSDDNPVKLLYFYNEQLKQNIRQTFRRSTDRTKPTRLFGFVDNVEDYMHISDLIITKPGGLTTSESLACRLPMAIFRSYPGQEAQNAEFLTENGIALMLSDTDALSTEITQVLSSAERLQQMRSCCERQSPCENSCASIFALMQEMTR